MNTSPRKITLRRGLAVASLFFVNVACGPMFSPLPVLFAPLVPPYQVLKAAAVAVTNGKTVVGLPNFGQVMPGIYRSAMPTDEGFLEAKRIGIRSVLTLRTEQDDTAALNAAGLKGFHVPLRATHAPTPAEENMILDILTDSRNQPVLIHCQRGIDRTGTVVALYRVRKQAWNSRAAYEEMKRFGFSSLLFPMLRKYVLGLQADSSPRNMPQARGRNE